MIYQELNLAPHLVSRGQHPAGPRAVAARLAAEGRAAADRPSSACPALASAICRSMFPSADCRSPSSNWSRLRGHWPPTPDSRVRRADQLADRRGRGPPVRRDPRSESGRDGHRLYQPFSGRSDANRRCLYGAPRRPLGRRRPIGRRDARRSWPARWSAARSTSCFPRSPHVAGEPLLEIRNLSGTTSPQRRQPHAASWRNLRPGGSGRRRTQRTGPSHLRTE